MSVPLPDSLGKAQVPIDVTSCDGLAGEPPHFFGREMPGFALVVDCNARLVRFKSRDWQITEAVGISGSGTIDGRVMHITRLVSDASGNDNCWTRIMGHITGKVRCGAAPNDVHVDYKVDWTFDETPPEVMEPASPGHADLRTGKHCKLKPGNCAFSNMASIGCGG